MTTSQLIDQAFQHGMIQMKEEITAFVDFLRTRTLTHILEIGSESGGTFYLWCKLARLGGLKISIDKPDGDSGSWTYVDQEKLKARTALFKTWAPRVKVITGDSHEQKIWLDVGDILNGQQLDLLFIDGDHSYQGVKSDYAMYRDLVKPGGLIAFHDIKDTECHLNRGCHVHTFWAELKAFNSRTPPDQRGWTMQEFIGEGDWGGIGCLQL
jgi:cephalosporin hydroxylase